MGFVVVLLLQLSLVATVLATTQAQAENWGHEIPYEKIGKEKMTHLHFYFHETFGGENTTTVTVAEAPTSNQSSTSFGRLFMTDCPLTVGPEPTSKLVGRAQGLLGYASQTESVSIMALSFVFTDGKFNGSTLSVFARNPIMIPVREISIVGGTGLFRFARGVANVKTYLFAPTSGSVIVIVEYNVTIIHY